VPLSNTGGEELQRFRDMRILIVVADGDFSSSVPVLELALFKGWQRNRQREMTVHVVSGATEACAALRAAVLDPERAAPDYGMSVGWLSDLMDSHAGHMKSFREYVASGCVTWSWTEPIAVADEPDFKWEYSLGALRRQRMQRSPALCDRLYYSQPPHGVPPHYPPSSICSGGQEVMRALPQCAPADVVPLASDWEAAMRRPWDDLLHNCSAAVQDLAAILHDIAQRAAPVFAEMRAEMRAVCEPGDAKRARYSESRDNTE